MRACGKKLVKFCTLTHIHTTAAKLVVRVFAGGKFRGDENFAGGKFREIPFAVDIIFAGGKFRAKSKFVNIAKISSTRKIGVIQYKKNVLCYEIKTTTSTSNSFIKVVVA